MLFDDKGLPDKRWRQVSSLAGRSASEETCRHRVSRGSKATWSYGTTPGTAFGSSTTTATPPGSGHSTEGGHSVGEPRRLVPRMASLGGMLMRLGPFLFTLVLALLGISLPTAASQGPVRRLLYLVSPDAAGGQGGRGIYVFDIDDGHKL